MTSYFELSTCCADAFSQKTATHQQECDSNTECLMKKDNKKRIFFSWLAQCIYSVKAMKVFEPLENTLPPLMSLNRKNIRRAFCIIFHKNAAPFHHYNLQNENAV